MKLFFLCNSMIYSTLIYILLTDIPLKAVTKKLKKVDPENVPPTEDLMKEHGLLNRILLIYEEIIRRIDQHDFQIKALGQALDIIRSFIHDYHEKIEENYFFPIFEKHKKEITLVRTLKKQHTMGRAITSELQQLCLIKQTAATQKQVKLLLKKFIRMYRPHEAREDTELFPVVRTLLTPEEFKKLGDICEDTEHELFGKHGFKTLLKKVENIEKELGIYKLEQFTS